MKKKIKSRSNSRPISRRETVLFFLINLFWIVVAAYNLYVFYGEYTASFKKDEDPIATVTFKYRSASRRFEERTIWDRLKQESPVYDGDIIRTENLSEATIHFVNGNELNLVDNSMTQVFLDEEKGLSAELFYGNILADAGEEGGEILITHEDKSVTVTKNSSAGISSGKEGEDAFSVQGVSGTTYIKNSLGESLVSEGENVNLEAGKINKSEIFLNSPKANEKIISGEELCNTKFSFTAKNIGDFKSKIEISQKKDFSSVYDKEEAAGKSDFTRPLKEGVNYWRILIDHDGGTETIQGRVFVIHSLPPSLIAPVKDYSYTFRKKYPAMRFIWTESEGAVSYKFEISGNRNMDNPSFVQNTSGTSSIVSEVGEGNWFWRVTPYYSIGKIGFYGSSETGSFMVKKKGDFLDPALIVPKSKDFVDTTEGAKNTTFSWESEPDAQRYVLQISDNPDMSNPKVKMFVETNYLSSDAKKLGITDGTWYWNVSAVDAEGNVSRRGETREFIALAGKIVQRSVYPPDGYKIAENLLANINFTWKTNLPYTSQFQISEKDDFSDICYESIALNEKHSGVILDPGKYYWRILAEDSNLGMEFATDVKVFYVLEPLIAPICVLPNTKQRAVVRPGHLTDFEWSKVKDADYYKFIVMDHRHGVKIFEQNLIQDTKFEVDMEAYPEGQYSWSVQAFSFETESCTRLSGLAGETSFALRKIYPVELTFPADRDKIDGKEALISPKDALWDTRDDLAKAELVIKNMKTGETFRINGPKRKQKMPRLKAGIYSWTVNAESTDGIDLSPDSDNFFTVLPIPPIPSTSIKGPADGSLLNDEYFMSDAKISFKWKEVPEATHYIFVLRNSKGKVLVNKKLEKTTYYDFTDIENLYEGKFSWEVEAVNCIEDGTILQESDVQKSAFEVKLGAISGELEKTGVLYNREKKKKR